MNFKRINDLNNSADEIVLTNLDDSLGETTSTVLQNTPKIRTYKLRWFILIVICLINISNAINGFCFTSIADFTGKFYNVDYTQVNLLSTISMIIIVPAGLASFIVIDYFGIRSSLTIAGMLNFIGAFFSVLSSIKQSNETPLVQLNEKYSVLMTGQVFCSIATPFSFLVTTKFANTWFSPNQRAIANTIALVSATFGILIGALISPAIVNSETDFGDQMATLNSTNCAISLLPAILTVFITRSTPPTPPTHLVNENFERQQPLKFYETFCIYFKQTGKLIKSIQFWILFFTFSIFYGLFNTLAILLQQVLCVRGYTDTEVGIFSGIMIGVGILGSLVAGMVVDKTKKFEEVAKIGFFISSLSNVLFAVLQGYNNDEGVVKGFMIFAFCLIGISGLPLLPICMEMSVECVHNISEATSTGLLLIGGQVVTIIMVMVYPKFAPEVLKSSFTYKSVQTCIKTNSMFNTTSSLSVVDYNNTIWSQSGIYLLVSVLFIVFFKCPYLRLRSECPEPVKFTNTISETVLT